MQLNTRRSLQGRSRKRNLTPFSSPGRTMMHKCSKSSTASPHPTQSSPTSKQSVHEPHAKLHPTQP
eukprot:4599602-Amphidinium_carterae.1